MTTPQTKTKRESTMISIWANQDICQIMTDSPWHPDRLNALFNLGFTYCDVVLVEAIYKEGQKGYAIKCTFTPLQTYLASFLAVFGWTENDNGFLCSPENSCLNGGDLVAVIVNSRNAFKSQVEQL